MPKNLKILLAGGGTGGHVLPLVEVARALKKLAPDAKVYFVGPEEFPLDDIEAEGVIVKKTLGAGKVRRYFSFLHLWELIKLPAAFVQTLFTALTINPDIVLGKGSYGSVLTVLCARILGKKIILHESDAAPGLANRFLSRLARNIAVAFEETKKFFPNKDVHVVGNPVRLKYLGMSKAEARGIIGLQTERKIIFVSGGSQGAERINNLILESMDGLLGRYALIWSVGQNNFTPILQSMGVRSDPNSQKENLKMLPLLNERELAAAYTLCDIAMGRAGSGTIFELAAFGKPAILIPLKRKGGDQPLNARAYAKTGAAVVLDETELTPPKLLAAIEELLADRGRLLSMSQKAREFARIDAGEQLVKILLDLAAVHSF